MRYLFLLLCFLYGQSHAQTLGGNSVFNFLRLPNTPQLTALGSVNISQQSDDVGMVFNNPALLKPSMHSQLNAVFSDFYGGIQAYHLSAGYSNEKMNTNFAGGLHFFNYGKTNETDASGTTTGIFRPTDWVMQVSASRSYLDHWQYGATLKFVSSNYGSYRSNGIALDIGVLFRDSASLFSASLVAKNMGTQLKKYNGSDGDDLPFDIQLGMTKRFAQAPFSLSLTAQRLQQFDIMYNDTAFNNENGFSNSSTKKFSFGKVVDHLVIGGTVYIGERIEIYGGYNFLRRKELRIGSSGNGFNGISMGLGILLSKLQIRYGRSYYQSGSAYNQLGLNIQLNQYLTSRKNEK